MKRHLFFISLVCIFTLSSCTNFLKGQELNEEIKKRLNYSNAKSVMVYANAVSGSGEFYYYTQKEEKVGYEFDLQFNLNKDNYVFNSWKITDSSKEADLSKKVQIIDNSTTAQKNSGIYKITVLIKEDITTLVITPECFLIPKLVSYTPDNISIFYPQDTNIRINFNKEIDINDFKNTNGSLKNISILLDDKTDVNSYFDKPYLINDDTTLVIPAKTNKNILDTSDTDITARISVKVTLSELTDKKDKVSFNEDLSFSYRINNRKDTNPPTILEAIRFAKTKEDVLDVNGNHLLTIPFSKYSSATTYYGLDYVNIIAKNIQTNHIKDSVWIYGKVSDNETEIDKIEIKETFLKKDTNNLNNYLGSYEIPKKDIITEKNNGRNEYLFTSEYTIHSEELNGVIRLEVFVYDKSGNCLEAGYSDVIMDKESDEYVFVCKNTNPASTSERQNLELCLVLKNYSKGYAQPLSGAYFGDNHYHIGRTEPLKIKAELRCSTDGLQWQNLPPPQISKKNTDSSLDYYNYFFSWEIQWDCSEDLYLKALVTDEVGNQREVVKVLQRPPVIKNVIKNQSNLTLITDRQPEDSYCVYYRKENSDEILPCSVDGSSTSIFYFNSVKSEIKITNPTLSELEAGNYYFYTQSYGGFDFVTPQSTYSYPVSLRNDYISNPTEYKNKVFTLYNENDSSDNTQNITFYGITSNLSPDPKEILIGEKGNAIPNSAVPKSEQIKQIITSNGLNSKSCTVKVEFTDDFIPDENFRYYLTCGNKYYEYGVEDWIYTTTISKIPSKISSLICIASDDNYRFVYSSTDEFTEDVIPPVVFFPSRIMHKPDKISLIQSDVLGSNCLLNTIRITDNNAYFGIPEGQNDKITLWKSHLTTLGLNDLTSNMQANTFVRGKQIDFFFDESTLTDSYYSLYIKVTDFDNNYYFGKVGISESPIEFNNNSIYKELLINKSAMDNNWYLDFTIPAKYQAYYDVEYFENGYWHDNSIFEDPADQKYNVHLPVGENTNYNNAYIKIYSATAKYSVTTTARTYPSNPTETNPVQFEYIDKTIPTYTYNNVAYVYPNYYTDNLKCNLRNVFTGDLGIYVLCDQLTFTHTLYSTVNHGLDYEMWETRGLETNVVMESSNYNYSFPDREQVPEGRWYTVITHFADGKVHITEPVLQK